SKQSVPITPFLNVPSQMYTFCADNAIEQLVLGDDEHIRIRIDHGPGDGMFSRNYYKIVSTARYYSSLSNQSYYRKSLKKLNFPPTVQCTLRIIEIDVLCDLSNNSLDDFCSTLFASPESSKRANLLFVIVLFEITRGFCDDVYKGALRPVRAEENMASIISRYLLLTLPSSLISRSWC
ncbi:8326_t:CDS:2, partial [Acaulospora morrowiae]